MPVRMGVRLLSTAQANHASRAVSTPSRLNSNEAPTGRMTKHSHRAGMARR